MIEFVQGKTLTISDWDIGVFASVEWSRQRAMVILMDGEGKVNKINHVIGELEKHNSEEAKEKLRILYEHLYLSDFVSQIDPNIFVADFDKPRSSSNPYGKILGHIPHPKSWMNVAQRGNSHTLERGGTYYFNPIWDWKLSGKSISRCYKLYQEFKEKDGIIWKELQREVRAGWKQPWRNITRENKENVAQHTEGGILLILNYKEIIKEELGCNWLEIARLITMFRIHDYPESYSGDTADSDHSLSPEEKERRSLEAAEYTFSKFGEDGEHLFGLWKEIEYSLSQTGKMGKEIDKVHAAKRSLFYETEGGNSFVEIYSGILKKNQVTFKTTQKMMIDLGMQYIGFLEGTNNREKIEEFKPILDSVFSLAISSKS